MLLNSTLFGEILDLSDEEERILNELSAKKYSKNPKTANNNSNETNHENEANEETNSALDDLIGLIGDDDDDDDDNNQEQHSAEATGQTADPEIRALKIEPKRIKLVKKEIETSTATTTQESKESTTTPTTASVKTETDLIEHNTGIKLIKPMCKSQAELNARLSYMGRFYKVSSLKQSATYLKETATTNPQDWYTIGLIGSKTDSRHSAKGNRYVIWHLYDLNNLDTPQQVSLFLFGSAYDACWKASELEVYAVLKPDFMGDNNTTNGNAKSASNRDEVSLCVRKEAQLVKLGVAGEITRCQYVGAKSDQAERCKKWVNSSRAPMCTYHCIMSNKSKKS